MRGLLHVEAADLWQAQAYPAPPESRKSRGSGRLSAGERLPQGDGGIGLGLPGQGHHAG